MGLEVSSFPCKRECWAVAIGGCTLKPSPIKVSESLDDPCSYTPVIPEYTTQNLVVVITTACLLNPTLRFGTREQV